MKQARWTIGATLAAGAIVAAASPSLAATFKVYPGDSIQAAVDAAVDGDKVIVYPGVYQENNTNVAAVLIDKSITLQGKPDKSTGEKVILEPYPGNGQSDGIRVEGADADHLIDGPRIKGMTVRNFPNNGIHLRYTSNFRIENCESIDNLENGIFPTLSATGLVKKNVAYGSDDAALWVEAATDVRVTKNEVYHAPTGLEVTISQNVVMDKNSVHDNTTGVGLYHPNGSALGLQDFANTGWVLNKNNIYNNNRQNTAPPGSSSASLPPGGGVLLLGVDLVQAEKNTIVDNDYYGVAMVDYCLAVEGSSRDCDLIPPLEDPTPDDNRFSNNTITGNGTAPSSLCSDDGVTMCTSNADCTMPATCEPHALADYAAQVILLLVDLENQTHGNKMCGGGLNKFSTDDFRALTPMGFAPEGFYSSKC